MTANFRRIATEEAFTTQEVVDRLSEVTQGLSENMDHFFVRGLLNRPNDPRKWKLLDVDTGRIAAMDAAGVDMHLLSLTSPGVQLFDADTAAGLAASVNDELAETIRRHPTRFAGLAAVAPQDPVRAAKEMERSINALGLHGFVINSHTNGEYLDQPKYWPILEAAEALDRPIYIHPRTLPDNAIAPYRDHFLWSAMWGYAVETGLHGMRLIVSGAFDRFPKLKIVLGHMGEGIPYWVYRIDHMYNVVSANAEERLKRKPSDYLKDNFLITTSGMNHHPALEYCLKVLGPENIMWAIDYPYQDSHEAVGFLDSAEISNADKALIYGGNAAKAFHIADA